MYNAAERKDVRKAEKQAAIAERQRHEVIFGLMQTIPGRRWVLEKLKESHIFATSFNRDPATMAFMEGQRDIGLRLLNDIMASCPDQYILMMREDNERHQSSERTRSQDGDRGDKGSSPAADLYTDSGDDDGDETSGGQEVYSQ